MAENPLDFIKNLDKELCDNINSNMELAFSKGVVPIKTKLLIAIAIDAAKNSENGVRSLVQRALNQGVTKEEVMETLRVVNYICGVGSIYSAAPAIKDLF